MSDDTIKKTVNLPQTDFPIRAGLAQKEPELLSFWDDEKIYKTLQNRGESAEERYTLHDGPPYPNGDIHMGHAMNKVLKDIAVRYQAMLGKATTFIPGWDCHGLPIETQVIKQLKASGDEAKKSDIRWFRNRCKEFALAYVDQQREAFKRLGIWGEWDKPYLTLNPEYEAQTVSLFGKMAENGLVYKGRKPIHWCTHCETALAEAEIEYETHKSPSIYVTFKVEIASDALDALIPEDVNAHFLVWTTTPWTLPSNVAIAAHPDFTYVVAEADGEVFVFVDALQERLTEVLAWETVTVLGTVRGHHLSGTEAKHPFLPRTAKVVTANYVTSEDGTGFVHIAPGHGQDDYLVGLEHDLPIIMPVDESGCFTEDVEWTGTFVFDANKAIGERMTQLGTLKKLKFISHSYPHCWRCKHPVIFRATEQWFIDMDRPTTHSGETLRDTALGMIKDTDWFPDWGEKRITPMIENRPDWCISRQRYWGIPIPVFNCKQCGHSEMTGAFNKAVVDMVAEEGTLAWFEKEARDILPEGLLCSGCGSSDFEKESDILDVWFESGSSFGSVLAQDERTTFPADLYLEGSDQHRGWFQSSLLIGAGAIDKSPFKGVLTHGFIVDEKGKKMSKSVGNVISPKQVLEQYGADILRWWIAGSDFRNDVSISDNILKQARDTFSKVRNTIRFSLSNLYDFDAKKDRVDFSDMQEIDRWILSRLGALVERVHAAYLRYDYHLISHGVHDFCAVELSSLYMDIVKDRLYCDAADSAARRSTQSALYLIIDTLLCLLAPILPFTCEDAYRYFDGLDKEKSIHYRQMPALFDGQIDEALDTKWAEVFKIKDAVYQQLEQLRKDKVIGSFLDAHVTLTVPNELMSVDWAAVLIVSQITVATGELAISCATAEGDKCQRCWKILPLEGELCGRCHPIVTASR